LLLHLIKEKEGFFPKPYLCPAGKLTIGYGFTDSKYIKRKTITEKEASRILREEIIPLYAAKVNEIVKVPLSPFQRAALVSFCYNCGEENLARLVNGRDRLNSGNYSSTPRIMQRYTKASGKTLQGLVSRREQEAKLFLGCL
jgi:lysozyme